MFLARALLALATLMATMELAHADVNAPWVIAIGNNVGLPDEPPLRYAERDALEMATVMQKHGNVPASQAVTLLGSGSLGLRAALTLTAERIRVTTPEALLIVFYSGHADARGLHLRGDVLPFAELERMVAAMPARLRVLIVDACRSGAVTRVKGLKPAREFTVDGEDAIAARGLAVITSSAAGEDSYESERLRASFFSHHLVTGLRGAADADDDQRVSLDELYRYTHDQTLKSSGLTRALQHPTFRWDVAGRGEVVLTQVGASTESARLLLPRPGTYLVLEGSASGPLIAEAVAERPGTRLILSPRRYFVQERQADHYLEYELHLRPGEDTALASISPRKVDYARFVRKGGGAAASHALRVHGGVRGALVEGLDLTPQIALGYGLDLRELSLGLRLRFSPPMALGEVSLDGLSRRHQELGLALAAQRYFDAAWASFGIGLVIEAAWVHQSFSHALKEVEVPARDALVGSFGIIASVQVPIGVGLQLELEGGPLAVVHEAERLVQGAPRGGETRSLVTWSLSGGVAWGF